MEFIKARYFTATNGRKIDLIVIHTMEAPESVNTAENVARYFASGSVRASAHYCIDNNSVVQCVRERDVAWHAPGVNHNSIGLEHAGYAKQGTAEWTDAYSQQMLSLSAALTAEIASRHSIPATFVDALGLQRGQRGITTHKMVSDAFRKSTHWDPGPGFPMSDYLGMVRRILAGSSAPAPTPREGVTVVNRPPIKLLSHSSWNGGYMIITDDGGVFAYGAPFFGSLGGTQLNQPIVDAAVTPSGQGYWMMGRDGGIFAFGDAKFMGRVEFSG